MIPVWLFLGSLSLGLPNMVLSVLVPLKCTWIPFLLHNFLNFSPVPDMYGTTMVMFLLLLLLSCWWTFDATGWVANQEIGTGEVLILCVWVPCPVGPVWMRLPWLCVLMCWRHFVWQWCDGSCPSVDIGPCGLVSCKLKCWMCCPVVWWLECLGMGVSLVVLVPL